MADIAEGWCKSGVRRLVVAGGETSARWWIDWGFPGFLVRARKFAAALPVLRAVGAKGRRDVAGANSGNFGGPAFFLPTP